MLSLNALGANETEMENEWSRAKSILEPLTTKEEWVVDESNWTSHIGNKK